MELKTKQLFFLCVKFLLRYDFCIKKIFEFFEFINRISISGRCNFGFFLTLHQQFRYGFEHLVAV